MLFVYVIAYTDGMGWDGWKERQHKAWSCLGFAWDGRSLIGFGPLGMDGLGGMVCLAYMAAVCIMDMDIGYGIEE
jgi:hypothetical protein